MLFTRNTVTCINEIKLRFEILRFNDAAGLLVKENILHCRLFRLHEEDIHDEGSKLIH